MTKHESAFIPSSFLPHLSERIHQETSEEIIMCSSKNIREELKFNPSYYNYGSIITEQHCHTNTEGPTMDKKARNKLILASVLCLFFMTLEIIGGFLANSLAIATDAAHLMTDFASFMISLFSIYLASRPATRNMSFGWHRAEVIGATVSVLMIWVVTGILVYIAIERIVSGEYEIDATIMLITSGVGVLVNIM